MSVILLISCVAYLLHHPKKINKVVMRKKLFREKPVKNYLQDKINHLKNSIGNLSLQSVNNRQFIDLEKNFLVDFPVIDTSKLKVTLNLEDPYGRIYNENLNAEYGRPDVFAIATCEIPFTGDAEIFDLFPQLYTSRDYLAEVSLNTIKFKVNSGYVRKDLPDEKKEFVRKCIIEVVQYIEDNLKNLKVPIQNYNDSLSGRIDEFIETKRMAADRGKKINDDLNPFI